MDTSSLTSRTTPVGKASRDKGKRGEREARDLVREQWQSPNCQRSAQVSGTFCADLLGGPEGLHLEVKRYKRIVALDFLEQAKEDSDEDATPLVVMREDGGEWALMVPFDRSVEFARRILAHLEDSQGDVS